VPQTKLETLGRVNNRRGTKVRFKPDTEIFGKEVGFSPRRLFKMARSKAYLFGGVEIRWRCAPALLVGIDKVPAEASFRFPGGLKDYLAREIEGKTLVADQVFSGKIVKPGGHGSLEWAVVWMATRTGSRPPTATPSRRLRAARTRAGCASRCCAGCASTPTAWARASA
jgi:topoisomerase-4 subunit B